MGRGQERAQHSQTRHSLRGRGFAALEDEFAITVGDDSDPGEERFVSLGLDGLLRVLVVAYTYRGDNVRIISARLAEPRERESYEAQL